MPDTHTMPYNDMLDVMESLERAMQRFYQGLSKRFTNPDLQRLWVTLAEQEETHVRLVRIMQKRSRKDEVLQKSTVEIDTREYQAIQKFFDEYPEMLHGDDLSPRKAFDTAIALENLELAPIVRPFLARQDQPTREVLGDLLASEEMHLNILVKAGKKHIDDPDFHENADRLLGKFSDASSANNF